MSLPELLKHIYHNATEEVIRRGKKIFHTSGVQLMENDPLTEQVTFRVRNDVYNNHYKVTVQKYLHPDQISLRCQCPYNMGTVCRHEAASLFQLNDLLQSGFFDHAHIDYDQSHTTVRMRQITLNFLKLFSSESIVAIAEDWYADRRIEILEAKEEAVRAVITDEDDKKFTITIKQNEERYFDTSCSCSEKKHPLCIHKVGAFLEILYKHGANYFSSLQNWDVQKNKLLAMYGYTLEDDLTGKFEFSYHEGKPFLRVLDKSIKKVIADVVGAKDAPLAAKVTTVNMGDKKLGVLISKGTSEYFPGTLFELVAANADDEGSQFTTNLERINAQQYIAPASLDEREKILITSLKKLSADELVKWLKKNSPFGEFLDGVDKELRTSPGKDLVNQVWDFLIPRYQKLFDQYKEFPFVYYTDGKVEKLPKISDLQQCKFSNVNFTTHLFVVPAKTTVNVELQFSLGDRIVAAKDVKMMNASLILVDGKFHPAASIEFVKIVSMFDESGVIKVKNKEWPKYLETELLPLSSSTSIAFDESLQESKTEEEPEYRLHLKEMEKTMIFKPIFSYNGIEKQWLDTSSAVSALKGKVVVHERNEAAEQSFLTMLRHLHPSMQESRKLKAFLLPSDEALKGSWYFKFMDALRDVNAQVFGYESLKQLRINPNKPVTDLKVSSGIDWFDATMTVAFGDQVVSIQDIKKVLSKKLNYINLKDGSVGLLSEEWMEKYSLMMKLGTLKDGKLRLNKFHFSALEHLSDEIGDNELLKELEEKKERLLNFTYDENQTVIPDNINAKLRPYQEAGFQWMTFLNETGWGGILADDMGLGKTLQTLSYLQNLHNKDENARFLVVCPSSLLYNWSNENAKFTPSMTSVIHHGSKRTSNIDELLKHNIIITSYGTLRSDVKMLGNFEFDYIVLDESQAIKNPTSQVAKASLQLKAKNRLAISGTPVQNNTFDLYAQMNFLNPGMLGSMDFFRNEFANPIDKNQEDEAKAQLRKMVYPFLLRRTKEQVATDLPKKVETVLFCEMGSKQRKVYETFRAEYRSKILGEIEEKGIEKAQMSILHGLMKLRQICDSPAILNESQPYDNNSIKIDELVRELTENTGKHKALVFSQFLGMLKLIREQLEKLGIPYVYFDGSTSMKEREEAINNFQEQEDCRVFLISLKAGGVGLNLTAGDYVYIVDPWWNPAVEQQAIDRTHRIGQTKNVFAYRLICKDTIEEKIMILQERKLNLVKDLITEDGAFLKKLTKEDISYLLS